MQLDEVIKTVFTEKKAFGSIYEKWQNKSWVEYFKSEKTPKKELSKESLELLEVFENITQKIFGKNIAKESIDTLKENFFVSTCDHHGMLCHPFFLNGALLRSSPKVFEKPKHIITLPFGSISASNSSFPRGLFFHDENGEIIRMPFLSLKYKSRPIYGLPALEKKDFEKVFDRTISKSSENIGRKIEQLKEIILKNEEVFKKDFYSEQCSLITSTLWKESFGQDRGEFLYIEIETLATELFLHKHIGKNTDIEKIIFDKKIRKSFIQNMEGIQGAHDTKNHKGSHFFWFLDGEKRHQLFLKDETLQTLDKTFTIPFTEDEIIKLLEERKLMPTMALCFSIVSFYHGLTCGGGFSQVGYLEEMLEAYEKTFRQTKSYKKTNIFTGELVLATGIWKKNNLPATLLDLFIYGAPHLSQKIDELITKTKVGTTLDLMMPEFYKIITGKNIKMESLPKISPVISDKKEQKCVYCGNNPTNHFRAWLFQSVAVPLTPVFRLISTVDGSFAQNLAKIILTPYLWLFRALGMIKMNKDKNKAFTKRSEVIWQEAEKRGIQMEQFVIWGKPIEQYRAKIGGSWKYFESLPLPHGGKADSYSWMDNKAILKKKFMKADVPVAYGASVTSLKKALEVFEKARKPVIVKPELGSRGRHTTTHIYTKDELIKGYNVAKQLCHFVVVEEHLFGSVYRATYVGGEITGILRGDPPRITGDGTHTIKELIEIKNQNKPELVKDVIITPLLTEFIGRQNLTLESILSVGTTIDLSEKIGISYGGYAAEEFPSTHPKLLNHLKTAGDLLKAPVVGFDFIIQDAKTDPSLQTWGIIEANSLPFINLHHFPLEGKPINVAGKVWDLWKKA